jgi:hypothetical protein
MKTIEAGLVGCRYAAKGTACKHFIAVVFGETYKPLSSGPPLADEYRKKVVTDPNTTGRSDNFSANSVFRGDPISIKAPIFESPNRFQSQSLVELLDSRHLVRLLFRRTLSIAFFRPQSSRGSFFY